LSFPNALATCKSPSLGIQFNYPEVWYLNDFTDSQDIFGVPTQVPSTLLTSFDPANLPTNWNGPNKPSACNFGAS
jgi:hypothetical protein